MGLDTGERRSDEVRALPYDHPQLGAFREVPRYDWLAVGQALFVGLAVLGVMVLALVGFQHFPGLRTGLDGFAYLVTAIGVAAWLGAVLGRGQMHRLAVARRARDDRSLSPKGDRYVGVAYCRGPVQFRGDTSWDRGYLSAIPGGFSFRGFGPEFVLPVSSVVDVRIEEFKLALIGPVHSVEVDWTDPEGAINTVRFEVPESRNCRETEQLSGWIREHAAVAYGPAPTGPLPFRSSKLDLSAVVCSETVRVSDRLVAAAWATVLFIVLVFGGTLLAVLMGVSTGWVGGIGLVPFVVYQLVLAKRVRSRSRSLHP